METRASVDWTSAATVLTCACAGRGLASSSAVGRALGGPVSAMLLGAAAATAGALPSDGGGGLRELQLVSASLATPMMLFGSNLRSIGRRAAAMVTPFAAACGASALGSALGFGSAGIDPRLAAALAAKNIGGGVNYVAVATTLGVSAEDFTAGIAVDNVFALLYFPLVSFWASRVEREEGGDGRGDAARSVRESANAETAKRGDVDEGGDEGASSAVDALTATAVAVAFLAAGAFIANVSGVTSATLPITTALTVAFATIAPERAAPLAAVAEPLATQLLFCFFVVAGASSGDISPQAMARYGRVFHFLGILYAVHLASVYAAIRLTRGAQTREFILASNAAVGGPATVAALAESARWRDLLVPGVLCGVAGNSIATFLGLALAAVFTVVAST